MNDIAVKVKNLSKAYRIGLRDLQHNTLGAALVAWFKSPVTSFRRLRNLGSIKNGEKGADIFWALRDIEFDVKKGEVLGIIGKNGAGKSTLLKILSRISEPSSGRIEIFGRVASLLEVGTGFNPELTGRENVYLNGTILGMTKKEIDSKFDAILDFSGVMKFIDTPVKRYSSGMKVRLAFAVAAHLDPEILIIDEVLAVGDAEFQKKCLGKMKSISEGEGRTVFFVSHNMAAIQQLCTSLILLQDGMIAGIAHNEESKNELVNKYLLGESISRESTIDLSSFERERRFLPCFHEIQIAGSRGVNGLKFYSGDSLKFIIKIKPTRRLVDPRFAIALEDNLGIRIMTFTSFSIVQELMSGDEYLLTADTEPLLLGPGQYFLSISLSEKQHGLVDNLSNFASIEFEWNNYYKNGEQHHSFYGPIVTRSTWSVEDAFN